MEQTENAVVPRCGLGRMVKHAIVLSASSNDKRYVREQEYCSVDKQIFISNF